jgi:hypothetical protein
MYKIRNGMPGNLTIDLEQGSITLGEGKSFDLEEDGKCSRKWINNNSLLKRWVDEGKILLLHDTGDTDIPPVPTGYVVGKVEPTSRKKKKKDKPQIIDFGKGEDITDDKEKIDAPEPTEPEVPATPEVEAPEPLPTMKMNKEALTEWAEALGMSVDREDKDMTKKKIFALITGTEAYQNLKKAWDEYKEATEDK